MSCFYAPLQHEALLHIEGPDSLKFLQGQTTCDTGQVTPEQSVPGAYCTPKGRVVCDFLLSQLGNDHFALRMRRDIRDNSAAVFSKYIVFSKAKLNSNDDWQIAAVWGESAAATLADSFGAIPEGRWGAVAGDDFKLVQIDSIAQQFECYLSDQAAEKLQAIAERAQLADELSWQALQIEAGQARICAATVEEFLPQMLNYDITGHVNFKKGCYTGQEVVARLHYRGKSKRRLYRALLPSGKEISSGIAAGEPLFSIGTEQSVGNIVNSVTLDGAHDKQTSALLVATADAAAKGLHLHSSDSEALTLLELPY